MSDKPGKIEHALQNPKWRLSAPNPQSKGKHATLSWDIWGNNPRMVLNTNDPSMANPDKGYGKTQAAIEGPTFFAVMELIEQATTAEPGWRRNIAVYANPRGANGPGVHPELHSDIWVGKNNEGVVYIAVIRNQDGWPKIEFPFAMPDRRFAKVNLITGTEYSKADLSVLYAKAYVRGLSQVMSAVLAKTYEKPAPFIPGNNRAGYSGGGGNRGGYSGGNKNSGGDEGGEDMPW